MIGGGNASGKTSALLAASAIQSALPKHHAVIFRKDYPSLKHIISASYALFLPMRASYNRSDHTWTFPSGATLEFSHLEDEAAVFQHAGKEYSFAAFDELTQLPGDTVASRGQPINSAFAYMQTRLRAAADSGLRLECRCTATPSGPGMNWVKDYFKIPDSGESCEHVDEVTGFRRQYVKALASDNPAIAADYHRQLLDLPAAQKKALLYGDWSSYEGQVFAEWDYRRHTCREFELPFEWDAWLGADDGYSAPAAVLLFAYDKTHDRIFIADEIYQRELLPEELAREVRAMCACHGRDGLDGVIDSSAFAEIGLGTEGGKGSRGDIMNAHGCNFKPSPKGAGSRVQGVSAIHQRLKLKADGFGGLVITRNCRNLIRTLPAMTYDRSNPEDIDPSCEEHATKALMYGLTRRTVSTQLYRVRGI